MIRANSYQRCWSKPRKKWTGQLSWDHRATTTGQWLLNHRLEAGMRLTPLGICPSMTICKPLGRTPSVVHRPSTRTAFRASRQLKFTNQCPMPTQSNWISVLRIKNSSDPYSSKSSLSKWIIYCFQEQARKITKKNQTESSDTNTTTSSRSKNFVTKQMMSLTPKYKYYKL